MSIIKDFQRLFGLFNKREKKNSIIMLLLIAGGGIAETIGIGVILPFTTILLDQTSVYRYPILQTITEIAWIGDYRRFIVLMCVALVLVFVLKSLYMFFLIYVQNRFALNRQIEMSKRLFQSYIYKPYEYFFKKNTAELMRNVNALVPSIIQGMLVAGLALLTEYMIIAFIVVLLLIVDPISTISLMAVLGGLGFLYFYVLKNKLDVAAKKQNIFGTDMTKQVKEGLGSIKDIKVLGREANFLQNYENSGRIFARVTAFFNLSNQSPRLLIETVAVSGLVILVVVNALRSPDMNASLPTIALFGMAAIRIMPSLNRILGYLTSIRFNTVHFNKIYDDLKEATSMNKEKAVASEKISFNETIEIKNMTYRYPEAEETVLDNVNLLIKKGQAIGIKGESGAGKTTLIDILLGLLTPEKGEVLVDGVNINTNVADWQNSIGYVPQSIFIIDDTVVSNVAFGVSKEEVDIERVWESLEIANLKETVEVLEFGLDTSVGESGVRLSGGQRQRLGIARALYHNPEILIFDEATSSLDSDSEKIIADAITKLGHTKTMIIIAHRLNTLEKCDVIYEVKDRGVSFAI